MVQGLPHNAMHEVSLAHVLMRVNGGLTNNGLVAYRFMRGDQGSGNEKPLGKVFIKFKGLNYAREYLDQPTCKDNHFGNDESVIPALGIDKSYGTSREISYAPMTLTCLIVAWAATELRRQNNPIVQGGRYGYKEMLRMYDFQTTAPSIYREPRCQEE